MVLLELQVALLVRARSAEWSKQKPLVWKTARLRPQWPSKCSKVCVREPNQICIIEEEFLQKELT